MKKNIKQRYIVSVLSMVVFFTGASRAELKSMSDEQLRNTSGQAIMDVVTLKNPVDNVKFVRIRKGANVEINANIKRVILGEYERDDKYTAYSSNFNRGARNDFHDSSFYALPLNLRNCNGQCYIPGSEMGVDSGADVILENLSLGYIDKQKNMKPMKIKNPYVELAFDNKTGKGNGKLIGVRFGAESQSGYLGNYSENGRMENGCRYNPSSCNYDGKRLSAPLPVFDTAKKGGVLSLSGNLNLVLEGDTGKLGYSAIPGVARANATPSLGFIPALADGLFGVPSTQSLGHMKHKGTTEFFISLATEEIEYPHVNNRNAMKVSMPRIQGSKVIFDKKFIKTIPGVTLHITDGVTIDHAVEAVTSYKKKYSNCYNGNLGVC